MADPLNRSAVLVTGMSGTGKSTALAELSRRGHRVVDTDDSGWIVEVDTPYGTEPMWDTVEVILGRVADRANPFGSLAEHRTKIARDLARFEPLLRAGADHELVTTVPVEQVVTVLEQIAAAVGGRAHGHR